MSGREHHWRAGEQEISCRIDGTTSHGTAHIGGHAYSFRLLDATTIEIAGKQHRFHVLHTRESATVWLDGRTFELKRATQQKPAEAATAATGDVRALMPGKLLRLSVNVGDTVTAKQTVAIMESMKMESVLVAPITGTVSELRFSAGDVVEMGDVVMVIEA
jgi:biotin carboxyl carrier protein